MSCDAVERSGNKILEKFVEISFTTYQESTRRELIFLVDIAEKWRPVFSAAGIFDINKSCLSKLFSSIVTYLVIIMQFHMALDEKKCQL